MNHFTKHVLTGEISRRPDQLHPLASGLFSKLLFAHFLRAVHVAFIRAFNKLVAPAARDRLCKVKSLRACRFK